MIKLIALLGLLIWSPNPIGLPTGACNCPPASNLQRQGQAGTNYTLGWQGHSAASGYEVWYTRSNDGYTAQITYTTSTTYTFQNLVAGNYAFFVVAICQEGKSELIGIEDIIEN